MPNSTRNVLCLVSVSLFAMWAPLAAGAATLTLLPSAVEVRSPFTSDGRLEVLIPQALSEEGAVAGYAVDLHRDYDYQVGWYWSPTAGLRVADPANGNRRWVSDPNNTKRLRSICQRVAGRTAFCTDDVGDRLYTFSEPDGLRLLDRGDPEALDVIAAALSEEGLELPAPIQVVWKVANARGDAGILAAAPGVEGASGGRHPVGVLHSPGRGWQLLSSLDPRLDIGADGINDLQFFNRHGDAVLNQGIVGGRQEVYFLDRDGAELTLLGLGPGNNSGLCSYLTDRRETCGLSFEGDFSSDPRSRVYLSWVFDPSGGVRQLVLPDGLRTWMVLSDGDLLVAGENGSKELTWAVYSPSREELTRLIGKKRIARFFPRGVKRLRRDSVELSAAGDILLTVSGSFRGRELTRYLYYDAETGRLDDVWNIMRSAKWIDLDRPQSFRARSDLVLDRFVAMSPSGQSLWLALVDGRPRSAVLTP